MLSFRAQLAGIRRLLLSTRIRSSGKKERDFLIIPQDNRLSSALEFKYDRAIPSRQNLPKANRAGVFFNDLLSLAYVPKSTAARKFFVYITDPQMASYFRNQNNRFAGLFELGMGEALQVSNEFLDRCRPSFEAKALCHFIPFEAVEVYACDLSEQHLLRILEIVT
jgi:hypothetical protein